MYLPQVSERPDGLVSIDFGAPGPFITLPPAKVRALVLALSDAGWITVGGRPTRPAS